MPARNLRPALICALSAVLLLWQLQPPASPAPPAKLAYRVAATYPHDPSAYTQGLIYAGGVLYESTGLYGRSTVRRVELSSGRVLAERRLPSRYFGEGLTLFADRLVQLTWRAGTAFVYDRKTLARVAERRYDTEGWGLAHDGESLILSDGSATLYFLDPTSFAERRRLQVFDHRGPVDRLNELEYVAGKIYANVWQTERIVVISPVSGRVIAWIDLSGLLADSDRLPSTDVANGIAYIPGSGRLLITGKRWPKLFALELETLP